MDQLWPQPMLDAECQQFKVYGNVLSGHDLLLCPLLNGGDRTAKNEFEQFQQGRFEFGGGGGFEQAGPFDGAMQCGDDCALEECFDESCLSLDPAAYNLPSPHMTLGGSSDHTNQFGGYFDFGGQVRDLSILPVKDPSCPDCQKPVSSRTAAGKKELLEGLDAQALQEILDCCCCGPSASTLPASSHSHGPSHDLSSHIHPRSPSIWPSTGGEVWQCRWSGCLHRFSTKEALRLHVDEHLGSPAVAGPTALPSSSGIAYAVDPILSHSSTPTLIASQSNSNTPLVSSGVFAAPVLPERCQWDGCFEPIPGPNAAATSQASYNAALAGNQDISALLARHGLSDVSVADAQQVALPVVGQGHPQFSRTALEAELKEATSQLVQHLVEKHLSTLSPVPDPPLATAEQDDQQKHHHHHHHHHRHATGGKGKAKSKRMHPYSAGTHPYGAATVGPQTTSKSGRARSPGSSSNASTSAAASSLGPTPATPPEPLSSGEESAFRCLWCGPAAGTSDLAPADATVKGKALQQTYQECGLYFTSSTELMNHISSDHVGKGHKRYTCHWGSCCNPEGGERKEYTQRQKVMRHLQTHTGDKPFECKECGRRFTELTTLTQHERTHTHEKPFACTWEGCGKAFSHASALTIHMRGHTGDKPFKCPHPGCTAAFSESSNLSKHVRTHKGEKNYACTWAGCSKAFARSDQLLRHARMHERKANGKEPTAGEMDMDDEGEELQ